MPHPQGDFKPQSRAHVLLLELPWPDIFCPKVFSVMAKEIFFFVNLAFEVYMSLTPNYSVHWFVDTILIIYAINLSSETIPPNTETFLVFIYLSPHQEHSSILSSSNMFEPPYHM